MTSGRGKRRTLTPEEQEYSDPLEECDEETLGTQFGHPGRLPEGWDVPSETKFVKEINLDHATDPEWQAFLESLDGKGDD